MKLLLTLITLSIFTSCATPLKKRIYKETTYQVTIDWSKERFVENSHVTCKDLTGKKYSKPAYKKVFANYFKCIDSIEYKKANAQITRAVAKRDNKLEDKRIENIRSYFAVHPTLRSKFEKATKQGQVKIGMTYELVIMAMGHPSTNNKTVNSYGERNQMVYRGGLYGKTKYIYLYNNVVSSYQN